MALTLKQSLAQITAQAQAAAQAAARARAETGGEAGAEGRTGQIPTTFLAPLPSKCFSWQPSSVTA